MTAKSGSIVALMIGRGGSSLKDKNILPVLGHPLLHWAAAAAQRSRHIGRYYISSDDDKILNTAARAGYTRIRRPDELASDTAQSCDAVRHALKAIEADGPVDIVVVQHANVGTISEEIIDACIDQLIADPGLSSVVPSHEYNEYHPMRAKGVTAEGLLKPFVETAGPVSANRQDLPVCYFFDHSIWALRADAIRTPGGQGPWDCMGTRIKPFPTKGCLDVHSLEDIKTTEDWIRANGVPFPPFDAPQDKARSDGAARAEFLEMIRLKLLDRNVPDSVFAWIEQNAGRIAIDYNLSRPGDLQLLNTKIEHLAGLADMLEDTAAPLPDSFRQTVLAVLRSKA